MEWFPPLVLFILWTVGFAWSLMPLETSDLFAGRYPNWDPDTVLYRRWLEQSIDRGTPVTVDTYQCFPEKYRIQFPPFYLRLLLGTVWLFFRCFPGVALPPELVAGMLPVLAMGVLNALLIWRFWRSTRSLAFCSLLAVCAVPGYPHNLTFLFLGIDHHWLECSCLWVTLLAAAGFEDSLRPGWKILGGLAIGLLIGTWMGSPLWHAILAAYVTAWWLWGERPAFARMAEFSSSSLLIGGGLLLLYEVFHPPLDNPWSVYQFSFLQPLSAVGAGLWCHFLREWAPADRWGRGMMIAFLVAGSAMGIAVLPRGGPLDEAKNFLLRKNFLVATVGEMQPMVHGHPLAHPTSDFSTLFSHFGLPFFLAPILLFPAAGKVFSGGNRILRDFLFVFLGMAIFQVRYGRWLGVGSGLLAGAVLFQFFHLCWKSLAGSPRRHWLAALALAPLLYLHLAAALGHSQSVVGMGPATTQALNWLQERTPPTSGYSNDDKLPEYGVLCFWDKGNYVTFLGRRPAVVSNTFLGYRTQAEILTAESEEEAYGLFVKYRVRYYFLGDDGMGAADHLYMNQLKRMSGEKTLTDLSDSSLLATGSWKPYTQAFDAWVRHGMTFTSVGNFRGFSSRFRWVYLSKETSRAKPVARILEAVPGAVLAGQGDPGSPVQAQLLVTLDRIEIPYVATGTADAQGLFRLRVPYSTGKKGGRVQTKPAYRVRMLQKAQPCEVWQEVPEVAVLQGQVLDLPAARPVVPGFEDLR